MLEAGTGLRPRRLRRGAACALRVGPRSTLHERLDGSAPTDELIDFAGRKKWRRAIGAYAEDYSEVAWRDWRRFRDAYRDGDFRG